INHYNISLVTGKIAGDSYEPDNSFRHATAIGSNTSQDHSIYPSDDLDYFSFDLPALSFVSIETTGQGYNNTVIYLYDSNYTLLTRDYDSGRDYFSLLEYYSLLPDQYYFLVEEYGNDEVIDAYTVTLTAVEMVDYEPNDSFAEATGITANSSQIQQIFPAGDQDYLTFDLLAGATVTVETAGSSGDTLLSLYDQDFVLLASDDDGGSDRFSLIENFGLPAGTYYILVEEYGNDAAINHYNISLVTGKIAGDSYEPDNSFRHATAIELNSTQNHSIIPANNSDYYWFELNEYSMVTIETSGLEGDDTVLYLYDSNYTLLTKDDDSSEISSFSLIDSYLLPPGRYYLMVEEYSNDDPITSYMISLRVNELTYTEYEPNDSFAQATEITVNSSQLHTIFPVGDQDYLFFLSEVEINVTIEITGSENSDTYLSLYDSNEDLIVSDDDSGDGFLSMIRNQIISAGRYYILIESYRRDTIIDSYTIILTSVLPATPTSRSNLIFTYLPVIAGIGGISVILLCLYKYRWQLNHQLKKLR
ncbi:MAG: PPC domain-containing protein, partial [Candidatus Odinarchaeota archaeon]